MKLLVTTQYRENYAIDENGNLGTGENAYWKNKGGEEYLVEGFQYVSNEATEKLIASLPGVAWANDFSTSEVIGWEVVPDDYQSYEERLQMEYDGKITYPTKVFSFQEQAYVTTVLALAA